MNPNETLKIQGYFDKPADYITSFNGSEGSSIVVANGENLKRPFKVGDRVHVNRGSWSQYLLASSQGLSHVLQDDLPLENAVSHWINPATSSISVRGLYLFFICILLICLTLSKSTLFIYFKVL